MEITVSAASGNATIDIIGRFDFSAHRGFKEAYDPQLGNGDISTITINLSAVDYMDSSALGMLLMLRDRALAANKTVILSRPNRTVTQILDIANFTKLFKIQN